MSSDNSDYHRLRNAVLFALRLCHHCRNGSCTAAAHIYLQDAAVITAAELGKELTANERRKQSDTNARAVTRYATTRAAAIAARTLGTN